MDQQALSRARIAHFLGLALGTPIVYGPPKVRRLDDRTLEASANWSPSRRPAHGNPATMPAATHCSGLVALFLSCWLGRARDYSPSSSTLALGWVAGSGRLRDVADWSLGRRRRVYWTPGPKRTAFADVSLAHPVYVCHSYHHAWVVLDLDSPWVGKPAGVLDGLASMPAPGLGIGDEGGWWRLAADGYRGKAGYSAGPVSFRSVRAWTAEATADPSSKQLFRLVGIKPDLRGDATETLRIAGKEV